MHRIGLISDSHGRVDHRVHQAFSDVDLIIHAGDICRPEVLVELETIAPVHAILGNCDDGYLPGYQLAHWTNFEVEGVRIGVVHDRREAGMLAAQVDVMVFGHSHMPYDQYDAGGTRWINPGSAQQARQYPHGRTVGILDIDMGEVADYRLVHLDDLGPQPVNR